MLKVAKLAIIETLGDTQELEAEVTKSEESDEAKSMVNVEKLVSSENSTSQ